MESRYLELPGLRVHYLADGEDGHKLPVVLVHGFPQNSHEWRHQIPALAAAGHPTYALDTRGFGRTDKPRIRITRAMLADDLVAFCDALDLSKVLLVGHDWGGIIAFKAAVDHPDRFIRLGLVDTTLTVSAPEVLHTYFYKVAPLAEQFFAEHGRDFIEVRMGGKDGAVLGGMPANPYKLPHGERPRPDWMGEADLQHYLDCFDADSQYAAIQYYRYAMPFHRVIADPAAPNGERYESVSEAEIAAAWNGPGGIAAHPLGQEYLDFGPEDRQKRYRHPALYVFGRNFLSRYPNARDGVPPSGNPMADQFTRYLPDLRTRFADCGHYIPEEKPDFLTALLLEFFED